jgi:hypothetical protein
MQRAAEGYVSGIDMGQLINFVESAGLKALYDGHAREAEELKHLINVGDYGDKLRWRLVSLLSAQPKLLKHFSQDFINGVASRYS